MGIGKRRLTIPLIALLCCINPSYGEECLCYSTVAHHTNLERGWVILHGEILPPQVKNIGICLARHTAAEGESYEFDRLLTPVPKNGRRQSQNEYEFDLRDARVRDTRTVSVHPKIKNRRVARPRIEANCTLGSVQCKLITNLSLEEAWDVKVRTYFDKVEISPQLKSRNSKWARQIAPYETCIDVGNENFFNSKEYRENYEGVALFQVEEDLPLDLVIQRPGTGKEDDFTQPLPIGKLEEGHFAEEENYRKVYLLKDRINEVYFSKGKGFAYERALKNKVYKSWGIAEESGFEPRIVIERVMPDE